MIQNKKLIIINNRSLNKNIFYMDEEETESGFKINDEEENDLDLPPEEMTDFDLDEEDPDKDN